MTWEPYNQGSGQQNEVDELGSALSLHLHCPVRMVTFGKPMYECRCGVIFPLYVVKGRDWDAIKQKHLDEGKLVKA